MASDAPRGVVFPADEQGRRSTSDLGRGVVADALRAADRAAANAAASEHDWRSGYLTPFRRLVEAGLPSREAALRIAQTGLESLHARMQVRTDEGKEHSLDRIWDDVVDRPQTARVVGSGEPARELSLPYRGERLAGSVLHRRLDAWVEAGVIEPSCAEAVRRVADNPDWLDLSDQTVAVLGAGAEMGPLISLLRWGGTVAAVDLPRPAIWERLISTARSSAGTLLAPLSLAADPGGEDAALAHSAGADLLHELPAVAAWLGGIEGPMTLGNYVYADGATNVRLSVAVDALTAHLTAQRPDIALAFLATPTDVFAVPAAAVGQSRSAYAASRPARRLARRSLNTVSRGRLLRPAYPTGTTEAGITEPAICDALVPQQGPNYALAKRLQRWRAAVARDAGSTVSFTVAPPTRTRSVVKNKALAAAYAGAHRFGVEVFDPATSNTLMAALLVHDLRTRPAAKPLPWQDEADAAAHGGLWRTAYEPRSALGLAALLGLGVARS